MEKRIFVFGSGLSGEFGLPLGGDLTEILVDPDNRAIDTDFYIFLVNHLQTLFPRYKRGKTSPPSLFEFLTLLQNSSQLSKF